MIRSDLKQQYDEVGPLLNQAIDRLKQELTDLLIEEKAQLHSISSRVKSPESFCHKASRPDRTYSDVWDMTDILGLRIVVYFEDSIEKIGAIIERNLKIDLDHSENKLQTKDNEKFGYRSLHYVCYLGEGYPEKARFEIQIRTILQHAWAEIEHDLGYKTNAEIPGGIRRRFSQLAGLLEIADREFVAIKDDLYSYEETVNKRETSALEANGIDAISIKSFVFMKEIEELDIALASKMGWQLSDDIFFPDYLVKVLKASRLTAPHLVFQALNQYRDSLYSFVKPYFKFTEKMWGFNQDSIEMIQRGYGLLFLAHLHILKEKSLILDRLNDLSAFYEAIDYPGSPHLAQEAAKNFIEILKEESTIDFF